MRDMQEEYKGNEVRSLRIISSLLNDTEVT